MQKHFVSLMMGASLPVLFLGAPVLAAVPPIPPPAPFSANSASLNTAPANIAKHGAYVILGTSESGNPNSPDNIIGYKLGLNGGGVAYERNGGMPGQYAQTIAQNMWSNAGQWAPALVSGRFCHNDLGGAVATLQPGTGNIGNCEFYLPRIVSELRKMGAYVVLGTEPLLLNASNTGDPTGQTLFATYKSYNSWLLNTYCPSVASDPGILCTDDASVLANANTGTPVDPYVSFTASAAATTGQGYVSLSSVSGLAPGMYVSSQGNSLGGSTGDLSGAFAIIQAVNPTGCTAPCILLAQNLTTAITSGEALVASLDMQDNVHWGTVGATKVANYKIAAMQAKGWLPNLGPFTSVATGEATTDNLFPNGTLEGAVTNNIPAGMSTSCATSQLMVTTDTTFRGNVWKYIGAPGSAQCLMQIAPLSVAAYRGQKIKVCQHLKASNFNAAGGVLYSVSAFFDVTPYPLATGFTADYAQPFTHANQDVEGDISFCADAVVPQTASTLSEVDTINAVPSTATVTPTFEEGELEVLPEWDPLWSGPPQTYSRKVTASATLTTTDRVVEVNSTLATTMTLPSAALMKGFRLSIISISTGTVTITPNGADTINGAATYSLNTQYQSLSIYSDGTAWWVGV